MTYILRSAGTRRLGLEKIYSLNAEGEDLSKCTETLTIYVNRICTKTHQSICEDEPCRSFHVQSIGKGY